jgi:hypothetical protein
MDMAGRFHPLQARSYARSNTDFRKLLRQGLVLHVAGEVANHLREQWEWFFEWPTLTQMREEAEEWDLSSEHLISRRVAAGGQCEDTEDDLHRAHLTVAYIALSKQKGGFSLTERAAINVCMWKHSGKVAPAAYIASAEEPGDTPHLFIVSLKKWFAEVTRAEREATRILKQHWQAVQDIAGKLLKSGSRRLTHGRVMKLVGDQFAQKSRAG